MCSTLLPLSSSCPSFRQEYVRHAGSRGNNSRICLGNLYVFIILKHNHFKIYTLPLSLLFSVGALTVKPSRLLPGQFRLGKKTSSPIVIGLWLSYEYNFNYANMAAIEKSPYGSHICGVSIIVRKMIVNRWRRGTHQWPRRPSGPHPWLGSRWRLL